ncbi:MAG: VCBS repeat-containing protein, partial [Myxococcaceae bacterium]|nr:VCBS repeat-containing protein [Myxococcaceae bacterium]
MTALLGLALLAAAPGGSTLERAAAGVVERLQQARLEGPVTLHVEAQLPALGRAFATVLCGRLVAAKVPCDTLEGVSVDAAVEQARARGRSTLVRLTVDVTGSALAVRGDALETWRNVWAGDEPSRSDRGAALGLTLDADAEALAFAPPLAPPPPAPAAPLVLSLTSFARLPMVPVALAAGDLDGDQRAEVAVLLGEEVVVFSPEGKVLARAGLSQAPLTGPGPREPFGALVIGAAPQRLTAWSARRAKAEVFALSGTTLEPRGTQDAVVLDGLGVRLEPGLNRFLPEAQLGGRAVRMPAGFQAASTRGGVTLLVWPDGTASLGRRLPPPGRLADVGAGSALADVDGDGAPELLVSTARTAGDEPAAQHGGEGAPQRGELRLDVQRHRAL